MDTRQQGAAIMEAQTKQILAHLESGKSITPINALNLFGVFRLSARINDIRNKGHKVVTDMIQSGDKRFASYRLDMK